MTKRYWHAVYTQSRQEKKVAENMKKNGFHVYLPLYKTVRQWSDRKKKVEVPLLPSYVFVWVDESEYYDILNTPGVVRYVMFEGKAAVIPEKQIDTLKQVVDGKMEVNISTAYLKKGTMVRIVEGPLKGMQGEVAYATGKQYFIIRLDHLGYLLKVEVHASSIDVI